MKTIKRVSLILMAMIASACMGSGGQETDQKNDPVIERHGETYVKLALNSYSFKQMLFDGLEGKEGGISLFDLLDYCAENNIDAIDPTGYFFPGYPEVPSDDYLYKFKKRAFQLGVDISGTGIKNDFASPDPEIRAAGVQLAKEWIEVASKLGAPVIRVFAGAIPEGYENKWDEVAAWMIESLKECAAYGEKFGVIVGVQNHGDMIQTADQAIRVAKAVNSEWFGIILDVGFFKTEDPFVDIERVIPYAVNWQLKESLFGKASPIDIDLERLMKIIKTSGYRGYLPIETLDTPGIPYEPYKVNPSFLEKVREAMEAEF